MIRVERRETEAEGHAAEALLASLDSQPGAWLGCDVEAEGLYRLESIGCVRPALGFYLDGRELKVLAFSPTGAGLLEQIRPLAAFQPVEGGLAVRFARGDSQPHSVIGVLRAFLALFSPPSRELALYGVLSFDYYRLADADSLPDDARRRMVLFFPERVLVVREDRARWVEFRFPDLAIPSETEAPAVAPARVEPEDELPPGAYAGRVREGLQRLRRGEVFTLVLSQIFRRDVTARASEAFGALRKLNPYPAMFFLNLGGGEKLFGASPDLQVRADSDWVESAPVCGTFRRGTDPMEDADQVRALLDSDKEDASLAACADSDRNDKAKVCVPESLELVTRRRVHFFSTIIHTIDHTRGRRRSGVDAFDILLAHSTPATVTGMPKRAALLAIEEIESGWRGWYAGAAARLASDGSVEVLTVLRAARLVGDRAEVRTGGSLLVDSDPRKEEAETRLKAETLFRVLAGESPRVSAVASGFDRRFRVSLVDLGDPLLPLFCACLQSVGCDISAHAGEDAITVLTDGRAGLQPAELASRQPLIAVGAGGLALLEAHGGTLVALQEPRYARRVEADALAGSFLAGLNRFELGLYSSQVIEERGLSANWRAVLVSQEGWVIVAENERLRQVAILCRPDSIQSLKADAGRRVLRAALERVHR